ncbi:DNA repair protein RecN [Flavobacterium orientale]|uniref:DNA repair protein RecN n=1 Tax=Flavobacterium orientale TaxID=1756020 RepID=A0A917D9P8_9FLAO|nr:DNA repair protein RecN [Flavobacterium orientale]GGD16687.1 DNA repair protein RecN [Flavobacterium orientale]
MLNALSIKNYALIEKLAIDFSNGFTIITGETGAGKSILLGALGLVLGKRADLNSLKNKEEKCIIEASFQIEKYNLEAFFAENDIDFEQQTIIRREILPNGKSRAFINDSPVSLQQVTELGIFLIDIHSQHQTLEITESKYQFEMIDALSNQREAVAAFYSKLQGLKNLESTLEQLKSSLQNQVKEQDYTTFLYEELVASNLQIGIQEELEEELSKLSNVELIREQLEKAITLSDNEQFGILQNLKEVKNLIFKISTISNQYAQIHERLESIQIEFKDILNEMNGLADTLVFEPEQLEVINSRLQIIYNLQKKHQVLSIEELLDIQNSLEDKVDSIVNIENEIGKLEVEISKLNEVLTLMSQEFRANRLMNIPKLETQLIEVLKLLGMPDAQIKIALNPTSLFNAYGQDEIQFLFSANKGSDLGLLKKVASGGEMSRLMLAVKAVLSNYSQLPTILFDEIDTGVSGEIADKMGEIMKDMSKNMQVFSITHLPQIAAKGDEHFKVFKTNINEVTQTQIEQLSSENRIIEIAQMLSGSSVSDSAINHAKALLN